MNNPSEYQDYPSESALGRLRKLFPVTNYKIYLNHAGCSPYSSLVKQALTEYIDESHGAIVEDYQKNLATRENLRMLLATMIKSQPDEIGFVKNTSAGISVLASGMNWRDGDRIILADCEFPSNIYPFINLERRGVKIDFIPCRERFNGFIDFEYIKSIITDKTRLISLSFVEFSNGFRNDLQNIGELCRENDIIFCVDGIQGLGSLPLDVQKSNIHFLSCAVHKWLMGPQGLAFIYVHPDLLNKISMSQIGWLSVKDAWDFFDYKLDLLDDSRRFEIGTENWPGIYGALASAGLLMEVGIEKIETHILKLNNKLIDGLQAQGLKTVSSTELKHRSGIVSFLFPGQEDKTQKLFEWLNQNSIIAAFRDKYLRFSPHFYNTEEDMGTVIMAVKKFIEKNI